MPVKILKTIPERGYMNDRFFLNKSKKMSSKFVPKSTKTYVKKAIKKSGELKEFIMNGDYNSLSNISATGTWYYQSVFNVQQGTGDGDRIGDKVTLSSINVAGVVHYPEDNQLFAGPIVENAQVRILLVQMKRGFDVTQLTGLLPTNSITGNLYTQDIQRVAYILADRKYTESPSKYVSISQGTTATSVYARPSENKYFSFKVKPKITRLEWNSGTTGNLPPDITGSLFFMYLQVNASGIIPELMNNQDIRITYRDS